MPLTYHNRLDYVEKAIHFRLHEMDLQVSERIGNVEIMIVMFVR
jgi:hypothetical protein